MWRFRNYYKFKEKLPLLEKIDADEKIYGEKIKDVKSRVKQLVLPLLLIAEEKKDADEIVKFAQIFDAELKNLDEEAHWEEQIETAIRNLNELEIKDEKGNEVNMLQSMLREDDCYEIYLIQFAEVLQITEKDERKEWCRGLSAYIKKRKAFPVRIGYGNLRYVAIPKVYVDKILSVKK